MTEAIAVADLGKRYRVGQTQRHRTMRDAMVAAVRAPFNRTARRSNGDAAFWALRHASFDVQPGEVLGLIGPNGAGKSTLLKILSRIVEPTEGDASIRGRVASLLEVGTGFHQELTGRENVYLNGAILGMRKAEIDRKFDEIVAFAETERFIDTPVKHYSSGMYMRLAFAVAAHLEPEILIVDEVLAVGDAGFQRKCLGRMQRVAHDGRTVLFVSHNMDAVRRLCTRAILLQKGTMIADGEPGDVIANYLARDTGPSRPDEWIDLGAAHRFGTGEARFIAASYSSGESTVASFPYPEGPLTFTLAIDSDVPRTIDSMAVKVSTASGTKLIDADISSVGDTLSLAAGRNVVTATLEAVHLTPGPYYVGFWLGTANGGTFDHIDSAFPIDVVNMTMSGFGTAVSTGLVPCCLHLHQPIADGVPAR